MKSNMSIGMISFTKNGSQLAHLLKHKILLSERMIQAYSIKKYAKENELYPLETTLKQWTKEQFQKREAIIFIGAVGIAVRAIAPFVKDKTVDPAVIVIDEQGKFVISLLSGHIGGANDFTTEIANYIHAIPVITTATDINGIFSVDTFAKKQHLIIDNMKLAKEISAALLDRETVGLLSDFPIKGRVPKEITMLEKEKIDSVSKSIYIAEKKTFVKTKKENKENECLETDIVEASPFNKTLYLLPCIYTLGIGCKKGTSVEKIEHLADEILQKHSIDKRQIEKITSIDLKANEAGLLQFCERRKLSLTTYTAEELEQAEGEFTTSEFVKKITGVSNVCERSAVLGSEQGSIIQKKVAKDGVTIAIAKKDWSVEFEW